MTSRWIARVLPLVLLSACAAVRATQQQPANAPAVARAPTFWVRPLRFDLQQAWEDPQTWARHVDAWTAAYRDGVKDYARARLVARNVQFLEPGQSPGDGIIVDASVSAIRRTTSGLGDDHLESDVVFVDARSGERLLTAKVDASSERFGPEGWTFGGRVKFCSVNLAKGVVRAMRDGRFPE
jgi:hypothetical protein